MTTELNKIFTVPLQLTIQGAVINLTPFKMGELPTVFKTINPISKLILDAVQSPENQLDSMMKVMTLGGDNVLDLIAIGAKQSRQWVDELEMDEGVALIAAILEVNASFFARKVLPLLTQVVKTAPTGQV